MMIINCSLREAPIKGNPTMKIQILLERLASDLFRQTHAPLCHMVATFPLHQPCKYPSDLDSIFLVSGPPEASRRSLPGGCEGAQCSRK